MANKLTQDELNKVNNLRQLEGAGFVFADKSYIPEYFTIDGCPGDYGDYLYKHPETKQEVTLSRSKEFGFFDVRDGNHVGKLRYS